MFIVNFEDRVSIEFVTCVQRLLQVAQSKFSVSINFKAALKGANQERLYGITVASNFLAAYKGSTFLTENELFKSCFFLNASQTVSDQLTTISSNFSLENSFPTENLSEYDYWIELQERIQVLLKRLNFKENLDYEFLPCIHQDFLKINVIGNDKIFQENLIFEKIGGALEGANPWELLLANIDDPEKLVAVVFDGGYELIK